MDVKEIINLIENLAPLNTQEEWDSSGWQVDLGERDVNKILLCLSLTQKVMYQAIENKCDMIISHHPFIFPHFIPFIYNKDIPIYSAHTNLDKSDGGTTDAFIKVLGFDSIQKFGDFLRFVELKEEISLIDLVNKIKTKLNIETVRVVNIYDRQKVSKIAFCAGSGAEFVADAGEIGADVFVTGDVKYHTALSSDVIIIDVGHFESEQPVLKTIENLFKNLKNANLGVVIADEKSPFINY